MRLDKFLVACGVGSRKEVKKILKAGQVTVNRVVEKSAKVHIDEAQDEVTCQGHILNYEKFVYYMLNKPKDVISATEDKQYRTVLDLLDERARQKEVFPVGRLDIDTHGLLLLTNNGALAHELLSPKKHVKKTYRAKVAGVMTQEDVIRFAQGIVLKDVTCQSADLEILAVDEKDQTSYVQIRIAEGKYHQVKRMVAACGKHVMDLQRISMGPLVLDSSLALGDYRRLTTSEIERFVVFGVDI